MSRGSPLPLALLLPLACTHSPTSEPTHAPGFEVTARGETAPSIGDPDDIAIWYNAEDPGNSLIVATDKDGGGLLLYELDGSLRQELGDAARNNVDLRMGVDLGGDLGPSALIASSNRNKDTIDFHTIDPETRMLVWLASIPSGIGEPYGLCMYRSPVDGRLYVIVDNEVGELLQYEINFDGPAQPSLSLARTMSLAGQLEGCVADDELARLYIGEEERGIWRVDAEPDAAAEPTLIHSVEAAYLSADVEGLTIYYASGGRGYLIASSQGSDSYAIFDRAGDNVYLTSFEIVAGEIDGAVESDGIDVINLPLGPLWPDGLFIAHDDRNDGSTRNFKLVGWGDIAAAADVPLLVDTTHHVPR